MWLRVFLSQIWARRLGIRLFRQVFPIGTLSLQILSMWLLNWRERPTEYRELSLILQCLAMTRLAGLLGV